MCFNHPGNSGWQIVGMDSNLQRYCTKTFGSTIQSEVQVCESGFFFRNKDRKFGRRWKLRQRCDTTRRYVRDKPVQRSSSFIRSKQRAGNGNRTRLPCEIRDSPGKMFS